jgi:hypothetical protein
MTDGWAGSTSSFTPPRVCSGSGTAAEKRSVLSDDAILVQRTVSETTDATAALIKLFRPNFRSSNIGIIDVLNGEKTGGKSGKET